MTEQNLSITKLLKWFFKEELRVYSTMFGQNRFLTFPLVIFLFAIAIGAAIPLFSISAQTAIITYAVLITLFGLQTGVIGFDARDSIENLLGETSRILFASKTLPITKQKLVLVFLIKDALFYTFVFLTPIVLGSTIGLALTPIENSLVEYITIMNIFNIYLVTITAFILGVSIGFMFTTINITEIYGLTITIAIIITLVLSVLIRETILSSLENLSLYITIGLSLILAILFILAGLLRFRAEETHVEQKTYSNLYRDIRNRISRIYTSNTPSVTVKTIVDIKRSAGGFWKVVFASAIIPITAFALIYAIDSFMILEPRPEFIYGGLISLIAYPIYTLLFRYDEIRTYKVYPITEKEIYHGKIFVFTLLSGILGSIYLLVITINTVSIIEYAIGLTIFMTLLLYQLGLLMNIVKDKPIEFLFDGLLFSKFALYVFIILVPTLVVGMFGQLLTIKTITIIYSLILFTGILGVLLIRQKNLD